MPVIEYHITCTTSCAEKMLKKQYHQDCQEWIEGLNERQIELIYEYIFEEDDFEVFKQIIDSN